MEKKEKQERMRENRKINKKESDIVTKESFCAVCALFSFLALLILCTRTLLFGEQVGGVIHSFLTGVFGYMAYPLAIGALYLSVTGLFGKRFVKNRKLVVCIACLLIGAAMIVHIALTMPWFDESGYLSKCFNAGESFPKTTVCGWVGGLLAFGIASLMTEIGAIIVFSCITAFFGYLCVMLIRKSVLAKKSDGTVSKGERKPFTQPVESFEQPIPLQKTDIPMQSKQTANGPVRSQTYPQEQYSENLGTAFAGNSVQPESTPGQESGYSGYNSGYTMPTVSQRPGVSLREEIVEGNGQADKSNNDSRAFSPFGFSGASGQNGKGMEQSYENSRAFLFGGTPAENYRKNLIFDPNSSANRRPSASAEQPSFNGYMSSYTTAYENSVNESSQQARPVKIVNDRSENHYGNTSGYTEQAAPISPLQPLEAQRPVPQEPLSYPSYKESIETESLSDYRATEATIPETESSVFGREAPLDGSENSIKEDNGGYKRHDYMNLFSTDNPNVFGRNDETPVRGEEPSFGRQSFLEENRSSRPEISIDDSRGGRNFGLNESFEESKDDELRDNRDGLHLLDDDEEEENPYSLRSDYDVSRNSRRRDSSRGGSEEAESPRIGFGREDSTTERGLDSEIIQPRATRAAVTPEPAQPAVPVQAEPPKSAEPPKPPKPRVIRPYVRVPLDDFDCRDIAPTANEDEVAETKENIIATLEEFKVTGASIASVTFGPTVTRYNVTIPRNISPKKVVALDQSIAISLHSSGVNIYPNYEDGVVSIEVPNKTRQFVQLGCMLTGDTFVNAKPSSLMFTMGKDVANRKIYGDISKMIHLLVAGSSGSGKSVFLGSLIISLIYKYSPEELRLILIDPKKTEFVLYNNLPHLMINEIITDAGKAVQSLNWAIGEMNRRYGLFEQMSRAGTYVVNLDEYNAQLEKSKRLPKIVIIIDELADLMLAAKKEMEDRIQNLTQKARAAGIHLIVATQRPSTDVITGVIKSNLPTRVAFYVATDVDSRVILDQTGAQKLLGKGDFLYTMPGIAAPVRVQSAFISSEDSQKVVNFIKSNNEAYYDEEATAFINSRGGYAGDDGNGGGNGDKGSVDPMYIEALKYVILSGSASISMIQRKCSAGYNRAGKIIEWMEDMGYISPFDGAKARRVLITKEEFESKYGPLS